MISEFRIKNFKKFKSEVFSFLPTGVTLLAGDNNSGKSSVLQAITLWQYCVNEFTRNIGAIALCRGEHPAPMQLLRLTPLPLPELRYLWNQQRTNTLIELSCSWFLNQAVPSSKRRLTFTLGLHNASLEVKVAFSNVLTGEKIPKATFLPAFAGIKSQEMPLAEEERQRIIGEGLAGAILRNVISDMYTSYKTNVAEMSGVTRSRFIKNSPWWRLNEVLQMIFELGLQVKVGDGPIVVNVQEVDLNSHGKTKRRLKTKPRDIMIEGSGFLQWLSVYALAVQPELDIILLDEPDAHLHTQLQNEMVFRVRNLVGKSGQVLMATHSTEILGSGECSNIYWLGNDNHGYLKDDDHRREMFVGLGGLYSPQIQLMRKSKRVLFLEGYSDFEVISTLSRTLGLNLPRDLAVLYDAGNSPFEAMKSRKQLFKILQKEIPGLRGISLVDRDDYRHYNETVASLEIGSTSDNPKARMWRRRNLENYLLCPHAIARAANRSVDDVERFLLEQHGFAIVGEFKKTDCHWSMALVDGKYILKKHPRSVENALGVTYLQIAEAMTKDEVPEDVITFIVELSGI
jgi:hypothetical protein